MTTCRGCGKRLIPIRRPDWPTLSANSAPQEAKPE